MAQFPALPLFTDAITADCSHLTDEEFGRYVRLLILMWRTPGCRIPADIHWICKRLRVDALAYAQLVQPILQEFCTQDAGCWTQKRLLKEYQYVQGLTEKRRKAAESRWSKGQVPENKKKRTMQMDMQPASKADAPTPTPTPTLIEDTNVSSSVDSAVVISTVQTDMWFQLFWNAYPGRGKDGAQGNGYKGSKQKAFLEFSKIIKQTKDGEHETIVRIINETAARYAEHLDRSGYPSKHASTWLHQRGWGDDYTSTRSSHPAATGRAGKHERARAAIFGDDTSIIEG